MAKYIVSLGDVPPIAVEAESRMDALVQARGKFSGTDEEWFGKEKAALTQDEYDFIGAILAGKLLVSVAKAFGAYTQEMKEFEKLVNGILGESNAE